MANDKVSLVNYFFILTKWRKLIVVNFLIVSLLAAAYTLIMPKTFTASTSILSPSDDDMGLGLSSLLANLPIAGLGIQGISEATYQIIAITNSRTVMERIAEKFDLMSRYGADNMEETVRALRQRVEVNINEDLTVSLNASASTSFFSGEEDENEARRLARDMANSFVVELDKINKDLKTEKARNQRIFIESRYHQNLSDLKKAEDEFKTFQEQYGVIALPEQTEATIQAAASLKAEITAKEVEVAVMTSYVSGSHSELTHTKRELNELRRKFNEMKDGFEPSVNSLSNGKGDAKLFLPLNQAPEIGLQYVRLFREVTLQQKILEFILPQYEQAKIQEARDTPTVQVLDEAVIPIKRKSPKRTIICLAAGFVSIVLSFLFALFAEYLMDLKSRNSPEFERLQFSASILQGDIRRLLRRK